MSELARKLLGIAVVAVVSLASVTVAAADNADQVSGRFDVKYEEVTSNCENTGMALTRGSLAVTKRKSSSVAVDIERIPIMAGAASKGGRVKATSKLGKTSIKGLDGRFSVAGTVNDDGVLQMVFVAEYYLQGKAYCTQSWNISGVRGAAAPADKSGKKANADDAVDSGGAHLAGASGQRFAAQLAPIE